MNIRHLTEDAPRVPYRVCASEPVVVEIGTWPIEPDQHVSVRVHVLREDETEEQRVVEAEWRRNAGDNSYWSAQIGPFRDGDRVEYVVIGRSPSGGAGSPSHTFTVGPRIYLALLWHQHQPLYTIGAERPPAIKPTQPWVRLHALRDYYSMAALVADHPRVHLTINLTPVLLKQIEQYAVEGVTDRALDLTSKPAGRLSAAEREEVLCTFFDAHWHHQIFPHARYAELFRMRHAADRFTTQDLRDLQMWFNLAWFGEEFREGAVSLPTGEVASVRPFVERGRDFSLSDVGEMVEEQRKILRAVIPIHRTLMERGQIEVSTTPFYHPILPLLIDTDQATIDRPGATHPPRFSHPEDADAQIAEAIRSHERHFGRAPGGMWPAEGAVSPAAVEHFGRHGVRWLATDAGVLARSGRWGYRSDDAEVLCRPYRAEEGEQRLAIFFRDPALSDQIGFHYHRYDEPNRAATAFLDEIKHRFSRRIQGEGDYVLTVALDGENAWGAYREDARPFLHALYGLLEGDEEVRTVTFSEYLAGDSSRRVPPHPLERMEKVHELHTGSWIDEWGSEPGADLGTWIGEPEENRAWELLGRARQDLVEGTTAERGPTAFESLYAAEGSDWFWWFGEDQDSGSDDVFDDLFRGHLASTYRERGAPVPAWLGTHIVPRPVTWSFAAPVESIQAGDRLVVRTNCPGSLEWKLDGAPGSRLELSAVGGVMAGVRRFQATLGPFPGDSEVRFRFLCGHPDCDRREPCCAGEERAVRITSGSSG